MRDAFLDRLKNKQLTNIDQYRRMQRTLSTLDNGDRQKEDTRDDWKQWQLVPVSSTPDVGDDTALLDPQSQGALGLYRAVKQLNEK